MNRILQLAVLPLVRQNAAKNGGLLLLSEIKVSRTNHLMVRTLATSSQTNESLIEQFLKDHDISVKGKKVPPPILNFEDGLIPENILKHVLSQFDKPTPIQSQVV